MKVDQKDRKRTPKLVSCIIDPTDHRILDLDPGFSEIIGESEERAIGERLDFFLERFRYAHDPITDDRGALLVRRSDGERFFARSWDQGAEGIRFTLRALPSDREGSLAEGDLFHELSRDLMAVGDLEDQEFLRVNPAFYRLLGYTEEEILNSNFFRFVHPEDREELKKHLQAMSEGRPIEGFRARGIRKDGGAIWIEWSGVAELSEGVFYAIGRKVDEEVRAKEKLERSEDRYHHLFEASPVAMLLHDGERVRDLNREAMKLLGVDHREELIGERVEDRYSIQRGKELLQQIRDVIHQKTSFGPFAATFKCEKGAPREVEIDGVPLVHEDQVNVHLVIRDVSKQKRAERELARREEEYRTIVEGVPEGIHMLAPEDPNGDSFRVEFVNEFFASSRNMKKEDFLGRDLWEFLKERGSEVLFDPPQRAFREKRTVDYSGEVDYRGEVRSYQARAIPVLNEGNECERVIVMSRDVTEQKRTEEELERIALIAKETDNLVIMTDADGLTEWVNDAFTRLTGYSKEEVIGKKPGDLLQGEDSDLEEIERIRTAIREHRSDVFELLNYSKDGGPYWVSIYLHPIFDEKGELSGYFSIQTDMTERRMMEERIRKNEKQFRNLVENMNEGILRLDRDYNIEYVNDHLLDRLGFDRDQLQGENLIELTEEFAPQNLEGIRRIFQRRKKGESGQNEFKIMNSQGEEVHFLVSGTPIFDEKERFQGAIAIFTDLTERKELEREVLQAVIQTQETERKRFAEDLHDGIGQILSGVKMQLDTLQEGDEGSRKESLSEIRSMIGTAIDETRNITHDLMPNELRDFGLIKAVEKLLYGIWNRNGVEVSFDPPDQEVKIPEEQQVAIYRIFQETVNNVVKHSGADRVEIRIREDEDSFRFHVKDNGSGFDPETHSEGFGTTNIKRRADLYGGKIEVSSEPGKGTTVEGRIPITTR